MNKRILSALLTACMLIALIPMTAATVSAEEAVTYSYPTYKTADDPTSGISSWTTTTTSTYTLVNSASYFSSNSNTLDGSKTDGWFVLDGTFSLSQGIVIKGNVHLILADTCNVTITGASTQTYSAGIRVVHTSDSDNNALTIYGSANGTGKINVTGNAYSAGIGGYFLSGSAKKSGEITINGGDITATAASGACIGGCSGGATDTIVINGGKLNLPMNSTTGVSPACIGSANTSGETGTMVLNGGSITAVNNTANGSVFGGQQNSKCGTIYINGGFVDGKAKTPHGAISANLYLASNVALYYTNFNGSTFGTTFTEFTSDAAQPYQVNSRTYAYVKISSTNFPITYKSGDTTLNILGAPTTYDMVNGLSKEDLGKVIPDTVENYHFIGWYSAAENGEKVTSLAPSALQENNTTSVTLYARFALDVAMTITASSAGGYTSDDPDKDYYDSTNDQLIIAFGGICSGGDILNSVTEFGLYLYNVDTTGEDLNAAEKNTDYKIVCTGSELTTNGGRFYLIINVDNTSTVYYAKAYAKVTLSEDNVEHYFSGLISASANNERCIITDPGYKKN